MNLFELLIFSFFSVALLALGWFLSAKWGAAAWLVGIVPVALGWLWLLFGAVKGTITDVKHSIGSRPVCVRGKCRSRRDYVLVDSSPERATFRCRCGDLYISKVNLFLCVLPDDSEAPYMLRDPSGNWSRVDGNPIGPPPIPSPD